jgi:ketosteroid isomerase-like protein
VTDRDIQTVEAVLAAFRRGDAEAMLDLNHPDAEWVNPDYAIEPGTRRGREELRRAIERIFEFFETIDVESMERTPDGRILVITRVRSRGMGGGPGIEALTGTLYTVRDGLLVRYEWFRSPDEARAAAGV